MAKRRSTDPYAPPPMHHDRSGGIVRFVVIAAPLGAAAWGYTVYSQGEQTADLTPAQTEQQAPAAPQIADAADQAAPQPTTTETAPAQQPAQRPPLFPAGGTRRAGAAAINDNHTAVKSSAASESGQP